MNYCLAPNNVEYEAGQAASAVIQIFHTTRQGIEPSLSALVARAKPSDY